ncbi:MAG: phytoene/squalene synthase family protein [Anaerolineae bacterium]
MSGSLEQRLEAAYQTCDEITRRHSRSFYFSSSLLPPEKRRAARALYAFCRMSDNIVDSTHHHEQDRHSTCLHKLDVWQESLRSPLEEQTHPILLAWTDARQRYNIPLRYSDDLLDGMRMDLEKTRYDTFDELWEYCYRAASVVGINSMYITGFENRPETFRKAELLGVALQMTNILRDVGEDWRRGRIYLPREDMERFGVTEADIAAGVVTDGYRALMQFEIERTHLLYEDAWPGIGLLAPDGRLAIAASAEVYHGILRRLERRAYDNLTHRAVVSTPGKLVMLPRIWWRVRGLDRSGEPALRPTVPEGQLAGMGIYARHH